MKKGLVVGINFYEQILPLHGCAKDAGDVRARLERNWDGSKNFDIRALVATNQSNLINRAVLRSEIQELFRGDCEIALFYFAGHGFIESTGGYLCPSDTKTGDDGISLADVMTLANLSSARNKIIILDSCHSGIAGNHNIAPVAELSEGTTILTASTAEQYAKEQNGSGVFTSLLVDALDGAAANLMGDVTPGSVYAHIDQSLGAWAQRPVFKTNVKTFVSLRRTEPPLELNDLKQIVHLFPQSGYEYKLDPSYEPFRTESEKIAPVCIAPKPEHNEIFAILQKYNRVNLVVPVGALHMWHAAMESKACKLTPLGEHYRRLVADGRI